MEETATCIRCNKIIRSTYAKNSMVDKVITIFIKKESKMPELCYSCYSELNKIVKDFMKTNDKVKLGFVPE